MKLLTNAFLTFGTLFFAACGENTTNTVAPDVNAVEINSSDIIMYSTDGNLSVRAFATYTDSAREDVTNFVDWASSNSSVASSSVGVISANANGGETNVIVNYSNFSDQMNVKVIKLTSINYSVIDTNYTSVAQDINVSGNFENNDANITMNDNITWLSDGNSTIQESDSSRISIIIGDQQALLYGVMFGAVFSCHPISKELLSISYSDVNVSDLENNQTIYIYGNYENNETNATLIHNILWTWDANSTIEEANSTAIALKIHNVPTTITATIFPGTDCAKDFNQTWQ